jgi:hypothetical protein
VCMYFASNLHTKIYLDIRQKKLKLLVFWNGGSRSYKMQSLFSTALFYEGSLPKSIKYEAFFVSLSTSLKKKHETVDRIRRPLGA